MLNYRAINVKTIAPQMKNYRVMNDKLSGDKWETCWVAGD